MDEEGKEAAEEVHLASGYHREWPCSGSDAGGRNRLAEKLAAVSTEDNHITR